MCDSRDFTVPSITCFVMRSCRLLIVCLFFMRFFSCVLQVESRLTFIDVCLRDDYRQTKVSIKTIMRRGSQRPRRIFSKSIPRDARIGSLSPPRFRDVRLRGRVLRRDRVLVPDDAFRLVKLFSVYLAAFFVYKLLSHVTLVSKISLNRSVTRGDSQLRNKRPSLSYSSRTCNFNFFFKEARYGKHDKRCFH